MDPAEQPSAGGTASLVYADVPTRVIAYIIDGIVIFLINLAIGIVLGIIGLAVIVGTGGGTNWFGSVIWALISLAVSGVYFVYSWTNQRATIGMRALSLQIGNAPEGATISGMLAAGEIDGFIAPRPPSVVEGHPNIGWLFPDPTRAAKDYYKRTEIFPIMHLVAIRRELYEQHRWIAQLLYKGFAEAQRMAYQDLHETAALKVMLPWLIQHVADTEQLMGQDFWAYGYAPNVEAIDRLLRYHHEQGLSKRQLTAREIFAPETLESYKI